MWRVRQPLRLARASDLSRRPSGRPKGVAPRPSLPVVKRICRTANSALFLWSGRSQSGHNATSFACPLAGRKTLTFCRTWTIMTIVSSSTMCGRSNDAVLCNIKAASAFLAPCCFVILCRQFPSCVRSVRAVSRPEQQAALPLRKHNHVAEIA